MPLTPAMSRMARAALGWSIDDLAEAASVEADLIRRLEAGEAMGPQVHSQLIRTFEAAGVRMRHSGPDMGAVIPPAPKPTGDGPVNPMTDYMLGKVRESEDG